MSCSSVCSLHTNHMLLWHYDSFKPHTSCEVNNRCSGLVGGVGNVSAADGWRFLFTVVFAGSGCALSSRRDAKHLIHKHCAWLLTSCSAWQAAEKVARYCTDLFIMQLRAALCFEATQIQIHVLKKWNVNPSDKKIAIALIFKQVVKMCERYFFIYLWWVICGCACLRFVERHTYSENSQSKM